MCRCERFARGAGRVVLWSLALAGLGLILFLAAEAQPAEPRAIPTPTYSTTATYAGKGDTLTVTQTVRPNNLPATVRSWWVTTVVPIIHVVVDGDQLFVFPYLGPAPGPNPKPDPKPDPKPAPPPVPTELWAIIVEETAQRTPQQAIVLASPKVRAMFKGVRVCDPVPGPVPNELKPYTDRVDAANLKKPVLFLTDLKGTIFFEGPLPETIPAVEALVDRIKKGMKP